VLADKLRPSGLKFVLFLSSVAGRFGNVGQSDYSAANEVLNKLADRLAAEWPEVRVRSINWGPWDSGMVTPGLRELYAAKGIGLVSRQAGVGMGLREISRDAHGPAEVVVAADLTAIMQAGLGRPL
jgi:NAD(P)-dependent dehydrogenase (short-subunit alcohol dehydrogenase family)